MIIQVRKRDNEGLSKNPGSYFNKPWEDYKKGFGDMDKDYWIGLETLYELTSVSGGDLDWLLEVGIS